MNYKILVLILLDPALTLPACKKDTQTDQENITKVMVHLSGSGGFDKQFAWSDPDGGDTGNASGDDIIIPAGTTNLQANMLVYDETKTPVADVTEEIMSENAVHLFTYQLSGTAISAVDYADQDDNGKHFGLKTAWTIGSGNGSVEIVLHHQPTNKDDLTNPGGEIDFDVTFPVTIQ